MEKTIREWFNDLPEDIKEKAIINTPEESLDRIEYSLSKALLRAFTWIESVEGHNYWSRINSEHE